MNNIEGDILIHCPECPTLLVRDYIKKATNKIAENIGLETQTRNLLTLAGRRYYPIDALDGREVIDVLSVFLEDQQVQYIIADGKVRLSDCPDKSNQRLTMVIALKPVSNEATTEEYQSAIVAYALYKLLSIPQQRWTNFELAQFHLQSFNLLKSKLSSIKVTSDIAKQALPMTLQPSYKWV